MGRVPYSSQVSKKHRFVLYGLPLLIGLLTPSLTLLAVQMLAGDVPFKRAVADVAQEQFAPGHNLFPIAVVGLIPFAALVARMSYYVRRRPLRACYVICGCGLLGILSLMVFGHVAVWYPAVGPGRLGSSAVIAFLFLPAYCLAPLFAGLGIGRLITRHPWFQPAPDGRCAGCGYNLFRNTSGRCPECGEPTGVVAASA